MDQRNKDAFNEYVFRLVALGEYPPDVKTDYDNDDRIPAFFRYCLDTVLFCVVDHNRRTVNEYCRSAD